QDLHGGHAARRDRGRDPAGEDRGQFDVSRQAISLHLKILSECGLLNIKQSGRERLCEVKLEKLNEVHEWVQQYQKMWTEKLKALKAFVEQEELQSQKAENPIIKTTSKKNKSKK
ncbi:MAG: ArsR/SmtB family transcription factor, partial [Flavobacteriales bacterium]